MADVYAHRNSGAMSLKLGAPPLLRRHVALHISHLCWDKPL
jgi:hypothetical protein